MHAVEFRRSYRSSHRSSTPISPRSDARREQLKADKLKLRALLDSENGLWEDGDYFPPNHLSQDSESETHKGRVCLYDGSISRPCASMGRRKPDHSGSRMDDCLIASSIDFMSILDDCCLAGQAMLFDALRKAGPSIAELGVMKKLQTKASEAVRRRRTPAPPRMEVRTGRAA